MTSEQCEAEEKVRVRVDISPQLAKEIDRAVKALDLDRAKFFRQAVREKLKSIATAQTP